jgi:hypothetical protein
MVKKYAVEIVDVAVNENEVTLRKEVDSQEAARKWIREEGMHHIKIDAMINKQTQIDDEKKCYYTFQIVRVCKRRGDRFVGVVNVYGGEVYYESSSDEMLTQRYMKRPYSLKIFGTTIAAYITVSHFRKNRRWSGVSTWKDLKQYKHSELCTIRNLSEEEKDQILQTLNKVPDIMITVYKDGKRRWDDPSMKETSLDQLYS